MLYRPCKRNIKSKGSSNMKKQSLGRGLESLIPKSNNGISTNQKGFLEINITDIIPNDNQPRTVFDEELLQELSDSIKEKGVIQPIIVTKLNDGKYMIIEGERRWRASGLAGKKSIPAVLRDANNPKERLELALITNAQRQDLNPVELAKAYAKLIEEHNYTQEDVSYIMGRSRSAVANRLRLLNLPEPALIAIEDNDISEGHARALLSLNDKDKILSMLTQIIDKSLSVRETENAVKKANTVKKEKIEYTPKAHILEIQSEIENYFKVKVNIKEKLKGGIIEIKYDNDDSLDSIIKKIRGELC